MSLFSDVYSHCWMMFHDWTSSKKPWQSFKRHRKGVFRIYQLPHFSREWLIVLCEPFRSFQWKDSEVTEECLDFSQEVLMFPYECPKGSLMGLNEDVHVSATGPREVCSSRWVLCTTLAEDQRGHSEGPEGCWWFWGSIVHLARLSDELSIHWSGSAGEPLHLTGGSWFVLLVSDGFTASVQHNTQQTLWATA